MYEKNKTKLAKMFHALLAGISLIILLGGINGASAATDLRITDENPMAMPPVGAYGLRVLNSTTLELTLITSKNPEPATVTNWNFVINGTFTAPATSQFQVTAGTQTIGVQSVGFKRRPLYAPLNNRDLRIANHIYLQLSAAIADGQTVTVKNASGSLWGTNVNYTTVADPFRFNPAIHVNGEGYMPAYVKKAMVGYYVGNLGELSIPSGNGFKIIDANSGTVVHSGTLTLRKDVGYTYSQIPYQKVYEADFSTFKTPGEYRLQIPGMGASYAFLIDEGIAGTFARSYALGLYHQRCGGANDYPCSRHVKGACHAKVVEIPNNNYSAVNNTLAIVTEDYAGHQAAGVPRLQNVSASLYPFVNTASFNATGGHHDAGDYSKYTINVAQLAHSLMFAVDSLSGVAALDNLGLPESGDGISDVMQEAKWELDFLAKLQDADGGFYFLVYPKDRRYEDNVSLQGTDLGDTQVVFPKNTAATAVSVAALAQAASSPKFKAAYPTVAANYLAKAKLGWQFLENAWARYGREGAYQKITHYGTEFKDKDEVAWAACELYLATGESKYHTELMSRFDPTDPNTRRWTWWRLFEGYGCAIRSYAFAARSGRVASGALNAAYLAKCEAEIIAAGNDQLTFSRNNAYANPFPDQNKPYRSAGWFMSVEQAYDVATAYQISPNTNLFEAVIGAMNYEAGCNPLNMGFLTGVGWKRQRETVNQYANNDRRTLPPSGIPLGSVWQSLPTIWQYGSELNSLVYPSDSTSVNNMYAPYDKWADTFNVMTEFVNPQQGHSLAAVAWLMAQTSVKTQAWKPVAATITGLPASVPAQEPVTAALSAPGVDLSRATIVWEARDQQPTPGQTFTFSAVNTGPQWVEAEALLPDGRRVFAKADFNATTATNTPPNSYQSAPATVQPNVVALYHLDSNGTDASGKQGAVTLAGGATYDTSNLGWMQNRTGANVHFLDVGQQVTGSVAYTDTWASDTQSISVDAMVYVNEFKGYNKANAVILSLERNWNAFLEFREDMYAGPTFRLGSSSTIAPAQVNAVFKKNTWHHLRMTIDKTGYTVKIDGVTLASIASSDLNNWSVNGPATLRFGNIDGWIDDVVVRHVRTSTPASNNPPTVSATVPGVSLTAPASVTLNATASDSDGTISKVEFYNGSTKLGEDLSSPYSFAWTSVPAGTYSITARATDNGGAASTSSAASLIVNAAVPATVATPTISPNGGTYTNSRVVILASTTSGATIRYTVNGSTPTSTSPAYTSAFTLTNSATVKAMAFATGMNNSAVATATFTIVPSATNPPPTTNVTKAVFIKHDQSTKGNWKGVYGNEGYHIIGEPVNYPAYVTPVLTGTTDWTAVNSTNDPSALLKVNSTTDRLISFWFTTNAFTIDLNITDGKSHRLALYFHDWNKKDRAENVQIIDRNTSTVLDTQSLSTFYNGRYAVWEISGNIRIRVTRTGGNQAIVNGLFLDAVPVKRKTVVSPSLGTTTPNQFQMQLTGQVGETFVIERSTDLTTWTPISTNTLTSTSQSFTDDTATNKMFFYRSVPTQ